MTKMPQVDLNLEEVFSIDGSEVFCKGCKVRLIWIKEVRCTKLIHYYTINKIVQLFDKIKRLEHLKKFLTLRDKSWKYKENRVVLPLAKTKLLKNEPNNMVMTESRFRYFDIEQLKVVKCFISGWLVCSMLAKRFRCDSDTPLDKPVVPLEYGMNATSAFDLLFFKIEVSTIGSSISSKSQAPSGLGPLPLTDIIYSGFTPGPAISCWASKTLGNNAGIVTTPCAPESLSW
ncbi:hypothetical protein FWK35_00003394 [Aphis craccivora]|uniref:Uncharacterized protein n=1 Tax=Aphis craccivora TaxID=307492 RepID=A0A6G0ZLQ3_APHCR|nr:hypothetical protein FWK35_00003394 [Aphis craccivora]